MPELPEVETVCRSLRPLLAGRRILRVEMGKTDFVDNPGEIAELAPGCAIGSVQRHGKFLELMLERAEANQSPLSLFVHLGMTGRLRVCDKEDEVAAHTHIVFGLNDARELRYTDPRRFGRMALVRRAERETILGKLGAEPLEITKADFCERIAKRRARIKALLLDQSVLRGIGNIYADESLWRARIHPMRLGAHLRRDEIAHLRSAVQKILSEAIRLGGSSISDFVDAAGAPGEFQLRHRAYGREGKGCPRCGSAIKRAIVAGRSSFYCGKCQRAPRQKTRRKGQRQRKIKIAPKRLNRAA
ncbi:MAG: bifunctional DNA-formamidopyrimidine glycosylase/DNA-(apurinic or apyrimidinic site) lyase [Candidatus Acidiferrales bacterium]